MTEQRLRQLARTGQLRWRGSMKDPLFPSDQLLALRPEQVPPIPDWLKLETLPPPRRRRGRPLNPPVYLADTVVRANVLDVLPTMPESCVSAVVCSPPYWGQRVYQDETPVGWGDGTLVPFGREETPESYVAHTLQILRGILRVLRPEGTVWWNIADSYMTRTIARKSSSDRIEHYAGRSRSTWAGNPYKRSSYGHSHLKDKDLSLVPFLIAVGAQKLGFWVRSVIVWSKQMAANDFDLVQPDGNGRTFEDGVLKGTPVNSVSAHVHVPETVTDRPITAHEYILLLTRSERYDYKFERLQSAGSSAAVNVRTVWTFPPTVWRGSHSARFPDELPRRCILLGSDEGGLVFDPFAGEGTTLRMAKKLGRRYFGCDISPTYVREARAALKRVLSEPEQPALPSMLEVGPAAR